MNILNDECEDLAVQPVDATLLGNGNMVGNDNVAETSSLTVEGVGELAKIAQLETHAMFATLIRRLMDEEMFEVISSNSRGLDVRHRLLTKQSMLTIRGKNKCLIECG